MADAPPLRGTQRHRGRPASQTAKQARENPLAMVETDVTIEVEDLSAPTRKPPINILIHGPAGHGKTLLAGGAADGSRNVWFLSTETEGVASARAVGSQAKLIRAPSWEAAVSGVKWFEANLTEDDWAVFDTGTQMQEMYMQWILQRENAINPQRDIDIPAIQNHLKYQNGFKRWCGRIIAAPYNVIFITTSMSVDDAEGESRVIPLLLGKKGEISDYVSSQFSVAIYYAVARESRDMTGPVIRRALNQPFPPWLAKDRYMALGKTWDVEENDFFAMSRMITAIEKSRGVSGSSGEANASRPRRPAGRVATQARRLPAPATPVRNKRGARSRSQAS
jgi:hypothetical protein